LRERQIGCRDDLAKVDLFDGLFDKQPHEGRDDSGALELFAVKRIAHLLAT
jgi:hypothetical protein